MDLNILSHNLNGDNTVGVIVVGLIVVAWVFHSVAAMFSRGGRDNNDW